jgi:hypothetical protein
MTFFINFFNNYLPPFLIIISILYLSHSLFLLIHHVDMKKQISMGLFMSMKCILIQININIEINNDELLKIIRKK